MTHGPKALGMGLDHEWGSGMSSRVAPSQPKKPKHEGLWSSVFARTKTWMSGPDQKIEVDNDDRQDDIQ